MDRERLAWLRLGAMASDAVALSLTFVGILALRVVLTRVWSFDLIPGPNPILRPVGFAGHLPLLFIVVPAWIGALYLRGSYRYLRRKRFGRIVSELAVAVLAGSMVLVTAVFALQLPEISRTVVVGFAVTSLPVLAVVRAGQLAALRRLRKRRFDPHRVLLLGPPEQTRPFREVVARHPEWGIELAGALTRGEGDDLPVLGAPEDLATVLERHPIDEVYLTSHGVSSEALLAAAAACEEVGVRLSMDANFLGLKTSAASLETFDGWSLLSFSSTPSEGTELVLKRVMDVVGAIVGLVALAPVLAVAAAAVRIEDGGPVLFVQERAGRFGRPFRMLKFRTMVVDAEARLDQIRDANEASGPVFKMRRDPRITGIGAVLRRTSVDELPQLVNVLLGHMSLVGPRPPLPEEVVRYERWQLRRLSMKPGLTCLWQVSGRSDVDFDRWMALDLEYIDNWSLWLDVVTILRTVPAVVRGTGAR